MEMTVYPIAAWRLMSFQLFLNAFCLDSESTFGCPDHGLRDEKHPVQQIIHAGGGVLYAEFFPDVYYQQLCRPQ